MNNTIGEERIVLSAMLSNPQERKRDMDIGYDVCPFAYTAGGVFCIGCRDNDTFHNKCMGNYLQNQCFEDAASKITRGAVQTVHL